MAIVANAPKLKDQNLPMLGKAIAAIQKHLKDKLAHED